jgi:hypothetical protein
MKSNRKSSRTMEARVFTFYETGPLILAIYSSIDGCGHLGGLASDLLGFALS